MRHSKKKHPTADDRARHAHPTCLQLGNGKEDSARYRAVQSNRQHLIDGRNIAYLNRSRHPWDRLNTPYRGPAVPLPGQDAYYVGKGDKLVSPDLKKGESAVPSKRKHVKTT